MTEPDFEAAKVRVYEEFGIWKPGEKCEGHVGLIDRVVVGSWQCGVCGRIWTSQPQHPHDIAPPGLTDAIAWRVLMAALIQSAELYRAWRPCTENVDYDRIERPLNEWFRSFHRGDDADPKRALILALDKALAGAHERI